MLALLLSLLWSHAIFAVDGADYMPLLDRGVAVLGFVYVVTRLEPRLRAIETSIDRLVRALMVAQHHMGQTEREQNLKIVEELERKEKE